MIGVCNSFLCTYVLCGPVRNIFDAGSIHYEGEWEGVEPWKSRLFGPCEMASSRQASAIWAQKKYQSVNGTQELIMIQYRSACRTQG
jgi:hypothetical protein